MTYSTTAPWRPTTKPISWEELWKAPKGKVSLDGQDYITNLALAGRMSGVPWSRVFSMKGAELDRATQRLIDLKPFQLPIAEAIAIDNFRTQKTYIAMIFSLGFGSTVNRKVGKNIARSVVPKEGVFGAVDGVMLIKNARNRDNALEFINFEGSKQAQMIFWDLYRGPTANRAATKAILARSGLERQLLLAQKGNEPKIAAALVQLRAPKYPEAWNEAWDRVLVK